MIKLELWPPNSSSRLEATADALEPGSFRKLAGHLERQSREMSGGEAGGEVLAHLDSLPETLVKDLSRLT